MNTHIEVLFSPAEFGALATRDLTQTVCVVFDILRATTSLVTALRAGAQRVIPAADIPEALSVKAREASVLLAGERDGVRILAPLTGGVDFDFGNSPREFTPERVAGRSLVMTTTNGTRALRACAGASAVLAASFLNLRATARWIEQRHPSRLLLVGSGTYEEAAMEDTLAAGALADMLWASYGIGQVADSTEIARSLYRLHQRDLLNAMQFARNGRRLLANPELRDDVRVCCQRETADLVAMQQPDGSLQRVASA